MGNIYVGDTGTDIILDSGSDISSQTSLKIKYRKPDGTVGEWAALVTETNKAKYTTLENDLDLAGIWQMQIYVELPDWSGYGELAEVAIHNPIG